MTTRLQATLEVALEKWVDDHYEDWDWPVAYIYEDQVADMAKAVTVMMDVNTKGQKLACEQEAGHSMG